MPMPVSSTVIGDRDVVLAGGLAWMRDVPTVTSTPPRIGELDGVADQVGDDLAQPHLVAQQRARQLRVDGPGDVDALLVGLRCQQLDHALHAVVDRQRPAQFSCSLSGLDLGEIEDLVDQDEQRAGGSLDGASIGLLFCGASSVSHSSDVMPRMPFIGVRISWLMAREEARLGAVGCLRLACAPPCSSASAQASSVMSRPRHCTSGDRRLAGRHGVLLPLEPAWPARRLDLLHVALLAQRAARRQRRHGIAGRDAMGETGGRARCSRSRPNTPQKASVDEGQAALGVAPQDNVGLVVRADRGNGPRSLGSPTGCP